MNPSPASSRPGILRIGLGLLLALLPMACGDQHAEGDGHAHAFADGDRAPVGPAADDHHAHGEEAAGATYQEGKGIVLMEETRKSLGLEVVEVGEQEVWPETRLTAQIYRSAGEASRVYGRERQGFAYATALVDPESAAQLQAGWKLRFHTSGKPDQIHAGIIWRIDATQIPILGKAEALLELPDDDRSLAVGTFVEARVPLGRAPQKRLAIPRSAVLETPTGRYAFVQNGGFLLRTEIRTGIEDGGSVEVTEGLYEGDSVAVRPVEALYMIELRATKGGGHCH